MAFFGTGVAESALTETPSLLPHPQCEVWHSKDNLSRCSGCQVVVYCGRDHQSSGGNKHKTACAQIKRTRAKLEREETKLREAPGDAFFQANPLENSVGHFWGILETHDYMRARYAVVEALLKSRIRDAVQAAVDHTLDMLRLCRSDNLGVRAFVPALYLRLGGDQEAYDFIRWWSKVADNSHYDWGNRDLLYLDTHGADVFEPVAEYSPSYELTVVGERVPQEILDSIREQIMSPVIASNNEIARDIAAGRSMTPHISKIEDHITALYDAVENENEHIWPALCSLGRHLTARPAYTSSGSSGKASLALQYNYDAWLETPDAIGIIRQRSDSGNIR